KSWFAGLSLTQPLYMGGKIRSAYQMSKIGKDMAFLNRKMSNSDVLYETDKAYWTLLKVEELVKVAQKYEEVVNHLLSDINNDFEVGMTSRNDILKVQVKLNEAKLQRRIAENAIRLAKMNLCHIIGLPLVDDVTVADQNLDSSATPLHLVQDVSLRPEYQ